MLLSVVSSTPARGHALDHATTLHGSGIIRWSFANLRFTSSNFEIPSEGCNKGCNGEPHLFRHVANCSINTSEHGSVSQNLIFLHINWMSDAGWREILLQTLPWTSGDAWILWITDNCTSFTLRNCSEMRRAQSCQWKQQYSQQTSGRFGAFSNLHRLCPRWSRKSICIPVQSFNINSPAFRCLHSSIVSALSSAPNCGL